jgi:hypothetical protein
VPIPTRIVAPRWLAAAIAAALWLSCASPPPAPPPAPEPVAAMDLSRIGRLGVLHFEGVGETALEPLARREFLAAVRSLQPRAVLVELGPADLPLGAVLDAAAIRAIARARGVDAVLAGSLWADTIDPVEFMQRARASAEPPAIEGTLSARIYDARDGKEIWRAEAQERQPITRVRVNAWGSKTVDAKHLDEVRERLVRGLVAQTTADFEPVAPPLAGPARPPQPRPAAGPVPAKPAGRD